MAIIMKLLLWQQSLDAQLTDIYVSQIMSLRDSNGIQTRNQLFCKQTLNHLAKLALPHLASQPFRQTDHLAKLALQLRGLQTKWLWVRISLLSGMAPASRKEFLDIQATMRCRFTLKLVRDMIISYSHIMSVLY